jgi:hypothetical protein
VILVVSHRNDPHAQAVLAELKRRGRPAILCDVARFPVSATATIRLGDSHRVVFDGIDLSCVTAVWLRRYGASRVAGTLDRHAATFARTQVTPFLRGLACSMPQATWFNTADVVVEQDGGYGKIEQLRTAEWSALEIPPTCVTSNPGDAAAFVKAHGPVICKPFRSTVERPTYCIVVEPDADLTNVLAAPMIFQKQIPKAFEVRTLVVGRRSMSTAIYSQQSVRGKVDFRLDYNVKHEPHQLPGVVESCLLDLMAVLGLEMGVHDLIVTPDGRYVYLETNQQGQWLWLQERTKQDYVGLVADGLTNAT